MTTVVICVRHPDFANDYKVFGDDVKIVDVDLGYSDLDDADEFAEWRESMEVDVDDLRKLGAILPPTSLQNLIDSEAAERFEEDQ